VALDPATAADEPENVVNVIMEEAAPFVATELVADQLLPRADRRD